jgi:N utilization substance protein A
VSRDEAEQMVMASRLKAGWITEADIAAGQEQEEEEAVEETAGA